MEETENLIETLALEPIEMNLFRGVSPSDGFPRIFGGFVIAQALLAAYETVQDRVCHSIHAYFIRPGDVRIPVLYEVDRSRDGGTFTTRRVIAIQNGKQIFNLAASFQVAEDGLEHQSPMPTHPDPESVQGEFERMIADYGDKIPEGLKRQMNRPRPIDLRWPDPQNMFKPVPKPPRKQVWMKAKVPIGPDIKLQQACLAYASDMAFMETALRVHGVTWQTPGLQSASLDHAMWFHRPVDFNNWVLFDQDCPSTSQGRGFIRGEMYTQDGMLAASVAQECLMRMKD
ncbi:MAG: acyl-CoA thioesterase II [Alphaproteobacteria bacterium]|jgi:acyl-CoA thioesterase II|nr:acyl-CoA thioesterase II [Alphaproteobacteria bacterium]